MKLFSGFFGGFSRFFKGIYHIFKIPGNIDAAEQKAQKLLDEVETHIPQALAVVQEIESFVPNHTTEEVLALGARYGFAPSLQPVELETMIQNAALIELQKLVANVHNSILRSAISIAVNMLKAHQSAL